MRRFADGEYMPLIWDGTPDSYYIKGHISHEDGIAILLEEEIIDEDTVIGQLVVADSKSQCLDWEFLRSDVANERNKGKKVYARFRK